MYISDPYVEYICPKCKTVSKAKGFLLKHYKIKVVGDKHQCTECDYTFGFNDHFKVEYKYDEYRI